VTTVAVTGAAGLIGRHLVDALIGREDVKRILALDRRVTTTSHPRLDARVADMRDPGLGELWDGVDVLVHLAFQLDHPRDLDEHRAVNVEGTRNVLSSAADRNVSRIIHLSSAMVYGAHADNPVPLREDAPLRVNEDFPYAAHKAEVEQWLWDWAAARPELSIAALRPSIITGPGIDNSVTRLLESPRLMAVRGHHPPFQFTHVDDVVAAILHLIDHPALTGPFNCASEGWLSFDELAAIADLRTIDVPAEVAWQLADVAWRAGAAPVPPGRLHYAMHPWVVAVDRLVDTGWHPHHSNREALQELVAQRRGTLALGPVRVPRWAPVAAVGGGLTAVLVAGLAWRRGRRGRRGRR